MPNRHWRPSWSSHWVFWSSVRVLRWFLRRNPKKFRAGPIYNWRDKALHQRRYRIFHL